MHLPNLIVVGPRSKTPEGYTVINTTSKAGWSSALSPFLLGPCSLYGGHTAQNVENLWQFSKVYKHQVDSNGNPTQDYWDWAKKGWADKWAHRYPMGKGAIPLYSWWDGHKLDYISARKKIYAPVYRDAVSKTEAYQSIKERLAKGEKLALWDYDGYTYQTKGFNLAQVLHYPKLKMGHALVLAMMINLGDTVNFETCPELTEVQHEPEQIGLL